MGKQLQGGAAVVKLPFETENGGKVACAAKGCLGQRVGASKFCSGHKAIVDELVRKAEEEARKSAKAKAPPASFRFKDRSPVGTCWVEGCLAKTANPKGRYCPGHKHAILAERTRQLWKRRAEAGEAPPHADIPHLTFAGKLTKWAEENPEAALDQLLAGRSLRNKLAPQLFLELVTRYLQRAGPNATKHLALLERKRQ